MALSASFFRKFFFSTFISVSLLSSYPAAAATPKFCATSIEKEALDLRVLQTELMVAALSCNEKANYGQFVKKFQPQLQQQANSLKSYFSKNYKRNSSTELNRFVTQLANGAAQRNAHTKPSEFCALSHLLFLETLEQNSTSLTRLTAEERFTSRHGIANCNNKAKSAAKVNTTKVANAARH